MSAGERLCTVGGCGGKHCARGLCSKHYQAVRSAGPLPKIERVRVCTVCGEAARTRGMCPKHYLAKNRADNYERTRAWDKAWRKANPESTRAAARNWREKNPDKVKAITRKSQRKFHEAHPEAKGEYYAKGVENLTNSLVRKYHRLPKDAPAGPVIDVHRLIIQIRRETKNER